MKNYLSLLLLGLSMFLSTQISGQEVFIDGPRELFCQKDSIIYTLQSNDQVIAEEWYFTTNQTQPSYFVSDSNTVVVNFIEPGTYTLHVSWFSPNNQGQDSLQIFVFEDVDNQIFLDGCYETSPSSGCTQVCAGSTTLALVEDFTGQTGQWLVSGAESIIDNGFSVEIVWGDAGVGEILFFSQCGTQSICVEIMPEPNADFSADPAIVGDLLEVCTNQEIYFENLSQGGITYEWLFGDGNTSDLFEPVHRYDQPGTYTLTLKANSVCECADEKQITVLVQPEPAPTLTCVNSVCPESRQRYDAMTDGCSVFNWTVSANGTVVNGGESTDDFIEIIWHSGPDGIIELSVSSCNVAYCSSTNRFRVPIISPDGPVSGDASVCSGEISNYTAPYFFGTEYNWQVGAFGNIIAGQNTNTVTVQWRDVSAVQNETVSVDYENCFLECGGSASFNVDITPTLSLSGDVVVCEGSDATVNAMAGFISSVSANVTWELQDENGAVLSSAGLSDSYSTTFNYPPGIYYWVAKNSDPAYCNDEVKLLVTVYAIPPPPLGFSGENEICAGVPYGFTVDPAGPYNTIWTINDGGAVTEYEGATISHTFTSNGPYEVGAAHTDVQFKQCASDYILKTPVSVTTLSIAGPDDICDQSTHTYDIIKVGGASYAWNVVPADMGEIQYVSESEIMVFWSKAGVANLELNICGTTLIKTVTVNPLPQFNIVGNLTTCSNTPSTIETDQSAMTHRWFDEFGSVIGTANTIDLLPGYYSVDITDAKGCTSSDYFKIESLAAPKALISSSNFGTFCGSVPGVDMISASNAVGYTYRWLKDGLEVGTGTAYTATDFGSYQLEITALNGCVDVSNNFDIVECCPPTDCFPGDGSSCGNLFYDFMLNEVEDGCAERTWSMDSPDLETGTGAWYVYPSGQGFSNFYSADQTSHKYQDPGYYRVIFYGRVNGFPYTDGLCKHNFAFIDTVPVVADFNFGKICVGTPVDFVDISKFLPDASIVSYAWDFGDPASGPDNTSTDASPSHLFSGEGTFDVILTVEAASGCFSTMTKQVVVSNGPTLNIDYLPTYCEDEATAFSVSGNLFNVEWDFDDGGSASENMAFTKNVFHTYNTPGIYDVKVSAEDIYGCRSEVLATVDIKMNTLSGNLTMTPGSAICQGEQVTITAPAGGVSWAWASGETTEAIVATDADQYGVFMRNADHCSYSPPTEYLTVDPKPVATIRGRVLHADGGAGPWVDQLTICDGEDFELRANVNTPANVLWGGGQTIPTITILAGQFNYPVVGNTTFDVTATSNPVGCVSDPATFNLTVLERPSTPTISLSAGSGCSFDANTLSVTNVQAGVTYIWSDGQSGSSITVSSAGDYSVVGTNANGCSAESSEFTILASPAVDQIAGGCFLACDPLTVCLPTLSGVTSYTIFNGGTTVQSGAGLPASYLISADGSYTIEVTGVNGCTATSMPLDVVLYQGVGVVTVLTYEDIDHDGAITAADQLLGNIPVQILSNDGLHKGMTETEANGQFDFVDFPSSGYEATINRDELSPMWKVVIDSISTAITNCGDSMVVSLLLDNNCEVFGPNQVFELCPDGANSVSYGDSTWTALGTYDVHFTSAAGCDSIESVDVVFPANYDIEINVWSDADQDGAVSFADSLMNGVDVEALNTTTSVVTNFVSSNAGPVGSSLTTDNYTISVPAASIPAGFGPVIVSVNISATECGTIVVDLLLEPTCQPATIFDQATICAGDSVLIGDTYQTETGVYPVLVSDPGAACDTVLEFTLTVTNPMTIMSTVDPSCLDNGPIGTITLEVMGDGPFTYNWMGDLTGDSVIFEVTPGIYTVEVTDQNLCTQLHTVNVMGQTDFNFFIDSVFTVEAGEPVLLQIEGDIDVPGFSVEWSPSDGLSCSDCFGPTAVLDEPQAYTITITDLTFGCVYTLNTFVEVFTTGTDFFMPNIFTPNDDGRNDVLLIKSWDEGARILDVKVINRWGSVVHQESNIDVADQRGWDGRFNNQALDPQVMLYVAKIRLSTGEEKSYTGDIFVLR